MFEHWLRTEGARRMGAVQLWSKLRDEASSTKHGEYCMVINHVVNKSRTSEDRCDLAIFKSKADLNKACKAVKAGDATKTYKS